MSINSWERVSINDIDKLHSSYACYAVIVDTAVMYIGRTKTLWNRIRRHGILQQFNQEDRTIEIAYDREAYDKEKELIQEYKPPLNIDYISKW
tara:strand:- start:159 stop:437 length:279 start_codon:yes stop_codon:yes gene_type:complete